jgi:hypothetical protein
MGKSFTIDVPHPCNESWDQMTLQEQGRFCHVCQKTVHDFTQFTHQEFIAFFQQKRAACGRFKKRQLSILIPPKRRTLFPLGKLPPLAAATLIATGLSISAPAQTATVEPASHVVIGDTLQQKAPVGAPLLLKGRVVDEKGEEIIGATIGLKGTTTGTVSDIDGNFELNVSESKEYNIEVKCIGMKSQRLIVKPGEQIDVTMEIDDSVEISGEVIYTRD